jgi:trehalose 6-phosphate synthase/phosphatase
MDSMHPDPDPLPPPSLADIREKVARLEASHRAKGVKLSGRVIHVCHHLPVEIVRVVPESDIEPGGILSPPMTPEFKPEDVEATIESVDSKWRIHARTAHPAMVSGIKSLSESHEQLVVAWTGEVLLQTQTAPSPKPPQKSTVPAMTSMINKMVPAQSADANSDVSPAAPGLPAQQHEKPLMVFGGEFSADEQKELTSELQRFSEVEAKLEPGTRLTYIPVFLPPDVSKGHYEGFCKKSTSV